MKIFFIRVIRGKVCVGSSAMRDNRPTRSHQAARFGASGEFLAPWFSAPELGGWKTCAN